MSVSGALLLENVAHYPFGPVYTSGVTIRQGRYIPMHTTLQIKRCGNFGLRTYPELIK